MCMGMAPGQRGGDVFVHQGPRVGWLQDPGGVGHADGWAEGGAVPCGVQEGVEGWVS